ncbi:unnamed protein product [Oikopleura dioica]|uniref:Uncharacterized protein n=1 Tax=Oikopleura dioica TaxID=34765 RepID=E4XZ43_OIKDI|nr:unnamed protein product [Oikopleura dioica]
MDEVRDSIDPRPPLFTSQFLASDLADIEQIEEKRQMEAAIGRRLMEATNQLNLALDDFRGRYKELRHLEESIQTLASIVRHGGRDQPSVPLPSENESAMDLDFINSDRATTTLSPSTVLGSTIAPLEDDQRTMITQSYRSCRTELFELDDDIPHLQCCKNLLGNVGNYGPCRVNEIKAITSLMRHGRTISRLIELSRSRVSFTLDSLKEYEFKFRPTLLMQWKSCCDNKTKLAVPVKTYKYELTGNYSSHVRKRPAVADQVFPELLRRILDRPDLTREEDLDNQIITVYQIIHYLEELKAEEQREFGKHVEMLSLELFISGELESGDEPSVLRAIGLLQSLLVRKHSNMKALAIMLLDENKKLRDAAAAHLRHIANEPGDGTWRPRDFALASYLELLEDKSKKLRRASCIALGFLNAKEALRQLQYVCMAGQEPEIREAAKNVLPKGSAIHQ